jgi:carboxylate-amine ligase
MTRLPWQVPQKHLGVITGEKMISLNFNGSRPYTLGVELELQLLDKKNLNLASRAEKILKASLKGNRITQEFMQCTIELQTGVCDSVSSIERELKETFVLAEDISEPEGVLLYAGGLHPFARPAEQRISKNPRYRHIMDELQLAGEEFIAHGMHVHTGVKDGDTAIRVCDIMQTYLPLLLALSASSPYFKGRDTGFASYRTKLFEALPLAGISTFSGNWQGYLDEVNLLEKRKIIKSIRDLWWDIRPSPGFGTVEVRVCDMPSRFSHTLCLTGIIQAMVAFIAESDINSMPPNLNLLRANKWQAARHGLRGRFCDIYGLMQKPEQSLASSVTDMLEHISPFAKRLGATPYIDTASRIISDGNGTDIQRRLASKGKSLREIISTTGKDYWLP